MTSDLSNSDRFSLLLKRAIEKRSKLVGNTDAFRIFSDGDGLPGVFIDVYKRSAVLIVYEGTAPRWFDAAGQAPMILQLFKPLGIESIYHKPFVKDRSKMAGQMPPCVTEASPLVGVTQPEMIIIKEHDWNLEIRLYDGLSTGLFLDQRENRKWVYDFCKTKSRSPMQVLNTFSYTCAFSIAAAIAGAVATSVDVSPRYLDWGKRNFQHNGLDPAAHWFAKMDTFEFFGYALRKGMKYDLIILDPPSFASGSKKKGIRPWSSVDDYSKLINQASRLLKPRGAIFSSTNTTELCKPGRLEKEILKGLGKSPKWIDLPEIPFDFAAERERFAARAFYV